MWEDERIQVPDEFDRRIDAALQSYIEPGEMPDARVALARVMERARLEELRRNRIGIWVVGLAIPACVLLAAVIWALWMVRVPRVPEIAWVPRTPGVVRVSENGGEGAAAPHPARPKIRRAQDRAPGFLVAKERLPKLGVFPTPRPLSPEERALVAFVREGPPAVRKAVIEDQEHWDDPIIVAGLREQPRQAGNQQDQ